MSDFNVKIQHEINNRLDELEKRINMRKHKDYRPVLEGTYHELQDLKDWVQANILETSTKPSINYDALLCIFKINNTRHFEIWQEGYATNGNSATASRLLKENEYNTLWEGRTFKKACKNAIRTLGYDMDDYDKKDNTYWGCSFFDNEEDARKAFG